MVLIDDSARGGQGYPKFVGRNPDAVEPDESPSWAAVGGSVAYSEAHLAMKMLCGSHPMLSMEVVEVNPVPETDRTTLPGVESAMPAKGKGILQHEFEVAFLTQPFTVCRCATKAP